MKRSLILVLILFCFCKLKAQTTTANAIHFNQTYAVESLLESEDCSGGELDLRVSHLANKIICTISTAGEKIVTGYLVRDTNPANKKTLGLYNFFKPKHKGIYLAVQFDTENGIPIAIIDNQEYLKIFDPCFGNKYINLKLKDK